MLSNERRPEPELKDVPTAKEAGYDVVWGSYYGIAGPPDLDPAVAAWWQDKISKMVQTAAWDEMMKESFLLSAPVVGADAKPTMDEIYNRFLTVLRDVGLAKK